MKKALVIILCIIILISGCSSLDNDSKDNSQETQTDKNAIVKKSGKTLIRRFRSSYPNEKIIYSSIEDMDNDGYKDTFIVTGSTNPKLWYLHPDGDIDVVLEAWGEYSLADTFERGNQKHLYIVCSNEPSVKQIWAFTLQNDKPKQILTSIANETIRITKEGFNLLIKEYDDKGIEDLVINYYTWDDTKKEYIKEVVNNVKEEKLNKEEEKASKEPKEKDINIEKANIDPSQLSPYYDHEFKQYGYQDDEGKIIIEPKFNYARKFKEEVAVVGISSKYGVIDKLGDWVIEPNYDNIRDFSEDLASANKENKWGFINKQGEVIIDFKYDGASYFTEGLAPVKVKSEWGYINKDGEMIVRPQIDTHYPFKDGKVDIRIGGRYGTMNKDGKITWGKVDTYTERQLLPTNENANNPDFKQFYENFLTAIKEKNLEFIKEHTSDNIRYSFGYDSGKEGFLEYWGLNKAPTESGFWDEMNNTLKLGGVFRNQEKTQYVAPYIFVTFPNDVDSFQYGVCIDEDVHVYFQPTRGSVVIEELDYSIIKVLEWELEITHDNGKTYNYAKVQLPDGYRGYMMSKNIRSPIDYRVQFTKNEDGIWMIDFFVAGD